MTHAFFPGGNGLYHGDVATHFPFRGTLILGSNFGSVKGFIDSRGRLLTSDERNNRTWKPLLKRLRASEIQLEECFFTNAWPFLHEGASNLGPIRDWLENRALMDACVRFFESTLSVMKPRLIVALGKGPAAFLSQFWPAELGVWKEYSLRALDALPFAVVHFEQQPNALCVAITHPSMPNAWRRRPPYHGNAGELELLVKARINSSRL